MPEVELNYLAIIIAAVASLALGSLWYGPLFGKQWLALSNLSQEKINAQKKAGMAKIYALALVSSLVMSYVLAYSLIFASAYLKIDGISAGLMSGFWNWLGFIAPVTLGVVLWEGKSWKLWCFNNCFQLISLLLMGVILALWK